MPWYLPSPAVGGCRPPWRDQPSIVQQKRGWRRSLLPGRRLLWTALALCRQRTKKKKICDCHTNLHESLLAGLGSMLLDSMAARHRLIEGFPAFDNRFRLVRLNLGWTGSHLKRAFLKLTH